MVVSRMFGCSNFLISERIFIVSKVFFISTTIVIIRAGGYLVDPLFDGVV